MHVSLGVAKPWYHDSDVLPFVYPYAQNIIGSSSAFVAIYVNDTQPFKSLQNAALIVVPWTLNDAFILKLLL